MYHLTVHAKSHSRRTIRDHVATRPPRKTQSDITHFCPSAHFTVVYLMSSTTHYCFLETIKLKTSNKNMRVAFLQWWLKLIVALSLAALPMSFGFFVPLQSSDTMIQLCSSRGATLTTDTSNALNRFQQKLKTGALSMTLDELSVVLKGRGRAQLAWDCYSRGFDPALVFGNSNTTISNTTQATSIPYVMSRRREQTLGTQALQLLSDTYEPLKLVQGGVASLLHVTQSPRDQTTKLLLQLSDGLAIESVLLPMSSTATTLCVSSQVGCAQACTFCATGRMGRLRSLTSDEILAQMFFAKKLCRDYTLPDITNVVFMG
jgi:hypothetical protein